jgi:poly-gamma-glutamate synthesis protein (capsule biosynthesis protein)
MTEALVTLLGCGDVGPIHEPVEAFSSLARPTLAAADIRFAQAERVYSERGALELHSGGAHTRLKSHMAAVFSDCGFDVVSLASNHAMDWGPDALIDTAELLRARGIEVVGAGCNLNEARRPAFVERNGVRIAFLAYCSVLRNGYAAGHDSPGVCPLRVHTRYEPVDYQPGVPPRVVTAPDEADLAAMIGDIKWAKDQARFVVLSLHWGVHFIPRLIADYQLAVARAAFEAGADLILGHHAHVPKAIGVYGGKICFFSLSNFIMSAPPRRGERAAEFSRRYGVELDAEYPNLPYGVDSKRSLIAKAVFSRTGVKRVSFLPVLIDRQLRPEVLGKNDTRFNEAMRYMEWASEGFDHRFSVEGDEVVISAG